MLQSGMRGYRAAGLVGQCQSTGRSQPILAKRGALDRKASIRRAVRALACRAGNSGWNTVASFPLKEIEASPMLRASFRIAPHRRPDSFAHLSADLTSCCLCAANATQGECRWGTRDVVPWSQLLTAVRSATRVGSIGILQENRCERRRGAAADHIARSLCVLARAADEHSPLAFADPLAGVSHEVAKIRPPVADRLDGDRRRRDELDSRSLAGQSYRRQRQQTRPFPAGAINRRRFSAPRNGGHSGTSRLLKACQEQSVAVRGRVRAGRSSAAPPADRPGRRRRGSVSAWGRAASCRSARRNRGSARSAG